MYTLIFFLATIGQVQDKHDPIPPLRINEGERVGRDHPLHHPHDEKHVDKHETKPVQKPHGGILNKPESQRFHPVRQLFRSSVEGACGILGFPGLFVKFIGWIELLGLVCVLTFFFSVIGGVGYVILRVLGVLK